MLIDIEFFISFEAAALEFSMFVMMMGIMLKRYKRIEKEKL